MTRSGLAATLKLCPSTICVVTQWQSSQVRIVRPPSILTRHYSYLIADNNFRYYLNTNIFMQSQYNLQMSIRMLAARKTEKMESFYLFIFAKWFCIFANGYQLFRLEERNTSTAHRCIAIIQYYRGQIFNLFATLLTWWPAESRCYSGDRSEWSHSWRTVEMNNNAWILIKLVREPVKKSKKISKFSFSTLSKRKTVTSCV